MSDPLLPLAAFVIAFATSLGLTPLVAWGMTRLGVIDHPKADRWHRVPVALLGGVAIYGAFATSVFSLPAFHEVASLVGLSFAVFLLGLYDDRFGTHPRIKFLIQAAVALSVILLETRWLLPPWGFADLAKAGIGFLWLVGVTNAMNLLDNMDGLSAGIAAIAGSAVAFLALVTFQVELAVLALALVGAAIGFLPYNYRPARLFMGDCGSLFLGFTLAALSFRLVIKASSADPARLLAPILILSLPIFDTTFVTVLRILNGRKPWQGGRDHTSHRLARATGKERRAVNLMYALAACGAVLGLVAWRYGVLVGIACLLVWSLALLWLAARLATIDVYGEEKARLELAVAGSGRLPTAREAALAARAPSDAGRTEPERGPFHVRAAAPGGSHVGAEN